jgi:YidC/Oxa1 family membrane protein insertase
MAQDKAVGVLTPELVDQGREATILGVPIYGTFMNADETPNPTATRVVTLVMIILMSLTTFITQRQLIVKNTAADNPIVRQQKLLLYIFPVMFAIGGINFPLGVLIYWLTTNLWSMGQQFWVIRNNPQPGTPAYDAKMKRDEHKAAKKGGGATTSTATVVPEVVEPTPPPRNQPKRQSRKKRKGS